MDKQGETQIIVNVAGKEKQLTFSNQATAFAFIKGASARFGDKFSVISRPDQCPECGSLEYTAYKDGKRYNPFERGQGLWDTCKCDECGHQWPFRIISLAPQQDMDNNKPATSGISDIGSGAPDFKTGGSLFESAVDKSTHWPEIVKGNWIDIPDNDREAQHRGFSNYPGIYVLLPGSNSVYGNTEGGFQSAEQAENYNREFCGGRGKVHVQIDRKQASNKQADTREYVIQVGNKYVTKSETGLGLTPSLNAAYHYDSFDNGREATADASKVKNTIANGEPVKLVPTSTLPFVVEGSMKQASGMNFSPSNVPSQVVQEFYPELQHELISYPNVTNSPMVNPDISGDMHELGTGAAEGIGEATLQLGDEELLPGAIEDAFDGMSRIGYISTSPAGGAGIGRDGKPQVLEGAPLRKENDIRGPMFTDEFYANYQEVPGAALAIISKKVAGADEKKQFALFLKKVMGEVAASFIASFKVTSRMPMNKVPGVGEIQLAQIEQATNTSAFNIVNTGSRVKYLLDKLTDSDVADCINDAFAQGAIWHEAKEGGFVYEVFVRAETIDTDSMILKYKFVTGTKEAE